MTALISVLMPVYNGQVFLGPAIESVLSQTMRDFELIVVDDGSTDDSPQILSAYAARDTRLRLYRQANTGIVGALNAGLAEARGRYIARMDADDVCVRHRFARQVAHLEDHPDCVLVGGMAQTIDAEGLPLGVVSGGRHRATDLSRFPPRVAVSLHPLIMVRRAALERVGGYRDAFPHAEDYDLYLRLASEGRLDNPPEVMLHYRKHEGAISQRNLSTQERSAALAELDAMAAARGLNRPVEPHSLGIAQETFEAYVRFRIWRRLQDLFPAEAALARRGVLREIFALKRLGSLAHHRLRVRMAGGLLKGAMTRLRRPAAGLPTASPQ